MSRPVFIPAMDMMGHTRRFLSTYDQYKIDFDLTHRDIVALLLSPERREKPATNGALGMFTSLLGGEVEEENERFYLRTPHGRQPMPLVAEGLRKIATLQQLVRNGHLQPGSVLFWDEPEVNLNPLLMDEVVAVLLALARTGVQIFLATHSYVILKELDLQATKQDAVRFFALESTPDGTVVHPSEDYAELHSNPIAEQFDSLYDRELTRCVRKRPK
jgi:ABC-type arginine transport system ATPase subunit